VRRFVMPLVFVIAVPLLCTIVATASRDQWDARWQAGLRRELVIRRPLMDGRVLQRYSLATLCADPRTAATIRPCGTYNLFSSLATAAYGVGALGVCFLGALAAMAHVARTSRRRLVRLFRPTLVGTAVGLVLLALAHGILGVAGLFLLGEVLGQWPGYVVLAMAIAGALVVVATIQVALAVTRRPRTGVVGHEVDAAQYPRLAGFLSEVATAVGAEGPPPAIVVGLGPGVFVTEARVSCLDGTTSGRALYLSLPLARILSTDELRGLLGHEFAHFAPADQAAANRFVPAFLSAEHAFHVWRHRSGGVRAALVWPALAVLSLLMEEFGPAAGRLGLVREEAADRAAAGLVGPATFASGLVKAHGFAPAWDAVTSAMDRAVAEGTQYVNAGLVFAQVVAANAIPERFAGLGARALSHPSDSHPPLGARLAALGIDPREVGVAALVIEPAQPAIGLVDGYESIEQELSTVEHRLRSMSREAAA
jgi:Zn-dependent protease with chaperone function